MINKEIFVGLDDGNFNTKITALFNNDGTGKLVKLSMPTRVTLGRQTQVSGISGVDNLANIYSVNGVDYTVLAEGDKSINSNVIDPRNMSYHKSPVNIIMVQHALKMAGIDSSYQVHLVTGLPFRDFFKADGSINNEIKAEKVNSFSVNWDNVICSDGTTPPRILSHKVLSEGAGAFLNERFEMNGSQSINQVSSALMDGPVSFVDIGGKTIDIVTFTQGGNSIINSLSNTCSFGALDFSENVSNFIKEELKINNTLPDKIDDAIRTGEYSAKGQIFNVSKLITKAKQLFCIRVEEEIRKVLKSADDINLIVFVGGGSIIIQDDLREIYTQSYFIQDPEFANSVGFLKAGFML